MEPQETNENKPTSPKATSRQVGIGIAVVALIAIVAVVFGSNKASETPATTDSTSSPQATTPTTPAVTAAPVADTSGSSAKTSGQVYKDGTYTATGSYMSPGGLDHVAVSLTLKNGIVTDATVTPEPGDNTSKYYQSMFVANYKPLVIGKNIADIKLSKVSGSSLTSGGFNDAVVQIETQAKA